MRSFLSVLCFAFICMAGQKQGKDNFAKLMQPFNKTAVGYYEQRLEGEAYSERERQPQDFIFYPIKKGKDAQWFHLAWLMPTSKERPLDQIFMCFSHHNTDSAKISFYDVPNPENYSKEWVKKRPFADIDFELLKASEPLTTGFLLYQKQSARILSLVHNLAIAEKHQRGYV